ncbi:uncharacterized protein LOC118563068 [Fundulus heteroclitus]|uniref:uncharacterized protein LOC118563068 n=1 Tax=Fundulus heteroclitus TaxID=8078 RepID=UPI00165C301E|nr:uncharacterized protein LOC118563068 [Fundulus heteroclitus]
MRGPRLETPVLFLLLLSSLTGKDQASAILPAIIIASFKLISAEITYQASAILPAIIIASFKLVSAEITYQASAILPAIIIASFKLVSAEITFTVDDASPTITSDPPGTDEESSLQTTLDPSANPDPLETGPTGQTDEEEGPDLLLILIPAVLAVVIIGAIVGVVIIMRCRKDNAQNQEPSKEGLDLEGFTTNNVYTVGVYTCVPRDNVKMMYRLY